MSAPIVEEPAPVWSGPGNEPPNKFLLVQIALQRARQLQNGAGPRVDTGGHKNNWIAMREVMAGMISWDVPPEPEREPLR